MSEHDYPHQDFSDDLPSKSRRKRDSHALQDLGEQLVELPESKLRRLPLPDDLRAAVLQARVIGERGAHKRQLQYIGKLMRQVDADPIRAALEEVRQGSARDTVLLHQCERWRERLLEEGDAALSELLAAHPGADGQHLRQLVRNARKEREQGKAPQAARELFRCVKTVVGGGRVERE